MLKLPSAYRYLFWQWCKDKQIDCEYHGTTLVYTDTPTRTTLHNLSIDEWYIGDDKHRMWAELRWA